MFNWLPTEGMAILGYVTAILLLGLVSIFWLGWAGAKHRNQQYDIIVPIRANTPQKHIYEVV